MVPEMATLQLNVADVPTAFFTGTLQANRNGTLNTPPPIPSRPDTLPIIEPTPKIPEGFGRFHEELGLKPIRALTATK